MVRQVPRCCKLCFILGRKRRRVVTLGLRDQVNKRGNLGLGGRLLLHLLSGRGGVGSRGSGLLGGLRGLVLLGLARSSSGFGLTAVGRGPEGKVVTQELHDQGGVTVRLLRQRVELSNGIIKRLLGQVAGTVGGVQDLIVKHREVEGQTQADGVGGGQIGLSNIGGALKRS